jgi:hypothetical protein
VQELIATAPRLRVLVTSQAALRIPAETIHPLAPLTVPADDSLDSLERSPAAALLFARATATGHALAADPGNAGEIAELCRELDGSPLAIELAAARLAILSPGELVQRLRRDPDALGTGGRGVPDRQRGLRAALEWSHSLLDPAGATLFRRLGHFAGDANLGRIEQVCGEDRADVFDALAGLVDFSLVRRTPAGRFTLPSALRPFARELLDAAGERDALFRRHAAALDDQLAPLAIERPLTAKDELCRVVDPEMADVMAVLGWSAQHDLRRFARLIAVLGEPLGERGVDVLWADDVDAAVEANLLDGRIGALLRLEQIAIRRDDDGMIALVGTADSEGDPLFAAYLHVMLVLAFIATGATPADRRWPAVRASFDAVRRAPPHLTGELGRELSGMILYGEQRWDEALAVFEATVAGNGVTAMAALALSADCHLFAGKPAHALSAYARTLQFCLEHGRYTNVGYQGEGIAAALSDLGRHVDSVEALGAADRFTPPGRRPRELSATASATITPRMDVARRALGPEPAQIAYARGAGLSISAAAQRLLALAGGHGTRQLAAPTEPCSKARPSSSRSRARRPGE